MPRPRTRALKEATQIARKYGFEPFDPADYRYDAKGAKGLCTKRECGQEAFFQKEIRSTMHSYCWQHMTDSVWNDDRYPARRVEGALDRLYELEDQYERGVAV